MNPLIIVNDSILAILFALFGLEAGVAMLYLFAYQKYNGPLSKYMRVSWEIAGTFLVFYLVDFEATFPGLLMPLGTIYLAPILIAAALILIRNAFLAYSEYSTEKSYNNSRLYQRIFSMATIIIMFLFVSILSSTVSGIGIDLNGLSINLVKILVSPYNILVFCGVLALSVVASLIYFDVRSLKLLVIAILVGCSSLLYALFAYLPYLSRLIISRFYIAIPLFLITIAMIVLYIIKYKSAKLLVMPWMFGTALTFELIEYPLLLGGSINITNYLQLQSSASYIIYITVAGCALVAIGIATLLYAHNLAKKKEENK